VLAYDADKAGQAAAERFYEWEKKYEIDIAVVALPPGADPADVARNDPDALRAAVEGARPFLAFRLDRLFDGADLRTPEARARVATAAMSIIAAHPNELVRDQYVMEVADRCRIDATKLRNLPVRRDTDGGGGAPSARPADADAGSMMGPEVEALRLAVHRPEEIGDRLEEVLFADELHLAAFRALAAADTLHEAIEKTDPGAAALLQRLAVEDSDSDPDDVIALLCEQAAGRAITDLEAEARASEERYLELAPTVGWLKLAMEQTSPDREPSTRVEASNRLVAWLLDRSEGGDRSIEESEEGA
jgi:DNA primase